VRVSRLHPPTLNSQLHAHRKQHHQLVCRTHQLAWGRLAAPSCSNSTHGLLCTQALRRRTLQTPFLERFLRNEDLPGVRWPSNWSHSIRRIVLGLAEPMDPTLHAFYRHGVTSNKSCKTHPKSCKTHPKSCKTRALQFHSVLDLSQRACTDNICSP